MALSDYDAELLARLNTAEFVVTNIGPQNILIKYDFLSGGVILHSDFGIVFGEYGNQAEWPLAVGKTDGAMAWAVAETKSRMLATADRLRAKLTAMQEA